MEYTKVRKQFGRAIGSVQALCHRTAAVYALVESARSVIYAAVATQSPADAAVAKVYGSQACRHIAALAVQLHGGDAISLRHRGPAVLHARTRQCPVLRPALFFARPSAFLNELATAAGLRSVSPTEPRRPAGGIIVHVLENWSEALNVQEPG
ncbi:hypothetical protein ABH922_000253 [Rhodococcus sp. 27YEA15]